MEVVFYLHGSNKDGCIYIHLQMRQERDNRKKSTQHPYKHKIKRDGYIKALDIRFKTTRIVAIVPHAPIRDRHIRKRKLIAFSRTKQGQK